MRRVRSETNLINSDSDSDSEPKFTYIRDKPKTIENEEEPNPSYLHLENIYQQTKQDAYLYKHYGNFPHETGKIMNQPFMSELYEQCFCGVADFGKRTTCSLSHQFPNRKHDLKNIYLYVRCQDPKQKLRSFRDVVHTIEIEIDGQRIQRYTGNFLELYAQLQRQVLTPSQGSNDIWVPIPITLLHQKMPFPFYYLKDHQFRVNVEFASLSDEAKESVSMDLATLYVEYKLPSPPQPTINIKELAPVRMLCEQVQFTGTEGLERYQACKIRLNFNGPIKTLLWNLYLRNEKGDRIDLPVPIMKSAKFQFDGRDLHNTLPASYFNTVMPAKFSSKELTGNPNLYVYTFATNPDWVRPTGSLNFNYKSACLQMSMNSDSWKEIPEEYSVMCDIYAVGYNVMEIDPELGVGFMFNT